MAAVFPLWPGFNIIVAQVNYTIFVYKYNLFIINVSRETFCGKLLYYLVNKKEELPNY